jgi:hypothetical protein
MNVFNATSRKHLMQMRELVAYIRINNAYVYMFLGSFDPLFRVLFTFPSQYFCAIGLVACI